MTAIKILIKKIPKINAINHPSVLTIYQKELLNMNMIKFLSIPGLISALALIIIMLPQDAGEWVQVIQLKGLIAMSFIVLSYTVHRCSIVSGCQSGVSACGSSWHPSRCSAACCRLSVSVVKWSRSSFNIKWPLRWRSDRTCK